MENNTHTSLTYGLNIQDRGIDSEATPLYSHGNDEATQIPTYNGIQIPDEVLRQLKMICHTPLTRLSRGEIEDAVIGFEGDGQIIEDPNGISLSDKMSKTWGEEDPPSKNSWADFSYWPQQLTAHVAEKKPSVDTHHDDEEHKRPDRRSSTASFVERYLESIRYGTLEAMI